MATIRAKLKELRDGDVRYISLVDRAATRIPFRVLKRDKEKAMGIDLTKVFKSEQTVTPHVSSLVVFAQKNEDAAKQIEAAIKTHGFITDRVQKSDEGETLVFAQSDQTDDAVVVRLSDQTLVSVAGLQAPEGWMGAWIEEHGFYPDVALATAELHEQVQEVVSKSDNPQADAEAVLTSYAHYLSQVMTLPTACFKLDDTIVDIVKKCACQEKKDEVVKESPEGETDEERAKRIKDHPPAETTVADEDDDQKPPPDAVAKVEALIKEMGEKTSVQLTALTSKLDAVVTEQAEQKKTLDGVVKKSDDLATTLKATVTAVPVPEDRPNSTRMRIQKSDDDPRTGNFDTAFLRRRQ